MPAHEHADNTNLRYAKWAFFAPPIFLFIYTFPAMISSANLLLFAFLAAMPVIGWKTEQRKKITLYLFSEIVIMLLIIAGTLALYYLSISRSAGSIETFETIANGIPVLSTVMTAEGAFPLIFIMEGLRLEKLSSLAYANIIATGTLLDELAVMHFADVNGTSFLGAFAYTQKLQGSSIYTLLTEGTQSGMPLQMFVPSIWPVLLPLFVLSFLAFFACVYLTQGESTIRIEAFLMMMAIGVGAAMAISALSIIFNELQFLIISSAVLATCAAAILSDRSHAEKLTQFTSPARLKRRE